MVFCTQTLLSQLMSQAEGGILSGVPQTDLIAFYHSPCPAELSQSLPECSPSSASPVQFPAQAGSPPLGQSGGHTVCCGAQSWWTPCVHFTEGEALRHHFTDRELQVLDVPNVPCTPSCLPTPLKSTSHWVPGSCPGLGPLDRTQYALSHFKSI